MSKNTPDSPESYTIHITISPVELSLILGAINKESLTLTQGLLTGKSFNREGDSKQLELLNKLKTELELQLKIHTASYNLYY